MIYYGVQLPPNILVRIALYEDQFPTGIPGGDLALYVNKMVSTHQGILFYFDNTFILVYGNRHTVRVEVRSSDTVFTILRHAKYVYDWLLSSTTYTRIESSTINKNLALVLTKRIKGIKMEGIRQKAIPTEQGEWKDEYLLAVIREDV